jgi:ribosomal protein S12 methylthiotransferase
MHQALIGQELRVLVESVDGASEIGRSYRDAPEVDGTVSCRGAATAGDFVRVRITEAMPYDLAGDIVGIEQPPRSDGRGR